MFHTYIQDVLWKIFQDWGLKSLRELTSKFPYCLGQRFASATAVVQTTLPFTGGKLWSQFPQTLKTPILKIFSQNILYLCGEHYSWCDGVIRKNNSSMTHLNVEAGSLSEMINKCVWIIKIGPLGSPGSPLLSNLMYRQTVCTAEETQKSSLPYLGGRKEMLFRKPGLGQFW